MAKDLEAPKPFVPSVFSDGNKLDAGNVEEMRFGLAGSGPLAKAVLDSNVVGARIQLGLGASAIAGVISMYGGTVLPAGYLWCDGSQQLIAAYPALFAALGVSRYGVDTATQFFLPDLRSRFTRGSSASGAAIVQTTNNIHQHNIDHNHNTNGANTSSTGDHNHNNNGANTGGNDNNNSFRFPASGTLITVANAGHTHGVNGASTSSTGGHNHSVNGASTVAATLTSANQDYVPAYVSVNYIIKT